MLTEYERDAIRPHVLGRFSDLLKATARSPAMLFYLDNWHERRPQRPALDPRIAARRQALRRAARTRSRRCSPAMPARRISRPSRARVD